MIKTFTQYPGLSRGLGLRKSLSGVLVAACIMAISSAAHADVFGGAAVNNGQSAALLERLNALERELKELKEKGVTSAPATPGAPVSGKSAAQAKPNLKIKPPPAIEGLEDLPEGGSSERERLLVEKEMSHVVIGTVNGMLVVRDGENRFVMTKEEFKSFEKDKRKKVVQRMKMDAVGEGEGARVTFPQLSPPPMPESAELSQAGQVVDQARAIEANGGQIPAPPPVMKPATTPSKPSTPVSGPHAPATPVKKN